MSLWPPPSPTSHCLVFDAPLRPPWPGNKPASDPDAESERAERLFTWLHAYELSCYELSSACNATLNELHVHKLEPDHAPRPECAAMGGV